MCGASQSEVSIITAPWVGRVKEFGYVTLGQRPHLLVVLESRRVETYRDASFLSVCCRSGFD